MSEFSHLKNKLLAEQVEDEIYHYILDTPLEPGTKLPNEFELGEKFGVGRSTVREAVKLLSSKGIVEVRRGSGTYVVTTAKGGDLYIEDDIAFHTCIAESSKNMVVEQLIPIIDTAVMMFVNVTHKKLTEETILTHRMITEAIARHDPIGARSAMVMHLNFNRNCIRKLYDGEWEN